MPRPVASLASLVPLAVALFLAAGCAGPASAPGASSDPQAGHAVAPHDVTGGTRPPQPPPRVPQGPQLDVSVEGVPFSDWSLRIVATSDHASTGTLEVTQTHLDQTVLGFQQSTLATLRVSVANGTSEPILLRMPALDLAEADLRVAYRGSDGSSAVAAVSVRFDDETGQRHVEPGESWDSIAQSTPFSNSVTVAVAGQQVRLELHGDADHWSFLSVALGNHSQPVQADLVLPYAHLEQHLVLVQPSPTSFLLQGTQQAAWTMRPFDGSMGGYIGPHVVLRTGPASNATVVCARGGLEGWTETDNPIAGCGDSTLGLWDAGPWKLVLADATAAQANFTLTHRGTEPYEVDIISVHGPLGHAWPTPVADAQGGLAFSVPWDPSAVDGHARITLLAEEDGMDVVRVWDYDVKDAPGHFLQPVRTLRPMPHLGS